MTLKTLTPHNKALPLSAYAERVHLHERYIATLEKAGKPSELVKDLLQMLGDSLAQFGINDPNQYDEKMQRTLLDSLITVLPPNSLSKEAEVKLNTLLHIEESQRETVHATELAKMPFFNVGNTKVLLWQGDITTLEIDAIVNAANNRLLGCFQPQHKCIDNVIHSRAGVQLRADCDAIMQQQGSAEPTGEAKVTRAYNLPSRYVIHTVGPIAQGRVTEQHKQQLASCYRRTLDACTQLSDIRSVAFCAISTGVFGYPVEQATPIALHTVTQWLKDNPNALDIVIFNVFSDRDHHIYQSVMEEFVCQH
ncbi:protein-ADP-ribose hydrolase [Enterovibrio baiacu]|uniref:protein-ADP-ribose hydrolase n=1 Tax=Enterovibrio baiacu TaxID=2491023 RepID=UPI003D09F6C4